VGTCGGIRPEVSVRDLVIAQTASTDSAMNRDVFGMYHYAPAASFSLLRRAVELAEERRLPHHVGGIVSSDIFYHPEGKAVYDVLARHGVLGVEMEAAALYTLAARQECRALAICAMTDSLITGEHIGPEERASSLKELAELALDVAVSG
jgi:purine-nucleoside phosphorylase